MGYKSMIAAQVQNAFRILGQQDGLAPAHDYVSAQTGGGSYNPATGKMASRLTVYPNVPMILTRFQIAEMDDQIVPVTDRKVLIAALDLAVVPKVQDMIYLKDGDTYMVERVMSVPGDSLYILHTRKTKRPV
jgi:hypothetical protein